MKVLSIVHQPNAGPGVFGEAASELLTWCPAQGPPPELDGVGAAMVFGGAMDTWQEQAHPWLGPEKDFLRSLLARELPVLGVCLGAQLLAEVAGARPQPAARLEIGWERVEVLADGASDPLIGPLAPAFEVFEWHSYEAPLPPRAVALARTPVCLQAFRLTDAPAWGLQFHAEVTEQNLNKWLDGWQGSRDAVNSGLDPEAIRAESRARIAAQGELGRALAERFLTEVAAVADSAAVP
jgi:GMP synthase-like glutamine amidotransferase